MDKFHQRFQNVFSPLKLGCSSVPQSPYVTCLWLCGLNLSVVNIFFLYFFSVPLDTGILGYVTVVLLETTHTTGDIFVFNANVVYWLL